MIDLRIYRLCALVAPVALLVAMFSLQSDPPPLRAGTSPDAFDGSRAATLARDLIARSPEPRPGSDEGRSMAQAVADRFAEIDGGTVSAQEFKGSFEGEEVDLANVIFVLPGISDRRVALVARRDAARGEGAQSAAAPTAALLEIASAFGGSTPDRTLVFASTDGAGIGAAGAKRLIEEIDIGGGLDAVVVLSQPAAGVPRQPFVIPWSTGPQSTAAQLVRSAEAALADQVEEEPAGEGWLGGIFRLALPAGLGEQAPLIAAGVDAVRISSAGELPPPPAEDESEDISARTLGEFGRAAMSLMMALDATPEEELEHGPRAYIQLGDNLLPGWALNLLALAFLFPVLIASTAGVLRSAIARPEAALHAIVWIASRCVPFFAALLAAYLVSVVGLIPRAGFPYEPGRFGPGIGGVAAALVLAVVLAAGVRYGGLLRPPPQRAGEVPIPAVVLCASLASLGAWLINPYLALLLAAAPNAWLFAAILGPGRGPGVAAPIVLAGMVPLLAAFLDLAGRLEVGIALPWHVAILVVDGHVGIPLAVLGCILAGCAASLIGMSLSGRARRREGPPEITVRGPEPGPEQDPDAGRKHRPEEAPPADSAEGDATSVEGAAGSPQVEEPRGDADLPLPSSYPGRDRS